MTVVAAAVRTARATAKTTAAATTIEGPAGTIARGLAEYDAADVGRLLGRRSDEHADLLGYAPRSALVHRNHLALL